MLTRTKKQIGYGLGFLIVLAGLVWLGARVFGPAAPVPTITPTPSEIFQPIAVEDATFIQHAPASVGDNLTVDIVIRLSNPNPRVGVAEYPITAELYDGQNRLLQQELLTTYILPGAPAFAVKINVPVAASVGRLAAKLPTDSKFTTIPASVSLPSFSTFLRERTIENIGATTIEEQKGVVTNRSGLDWQSVEVIGVALSGAGKPIGVGRTSAGQLKVGEQREFTVQWPATREPVSRVIVLPTTNIYRQENIIRAIGDPGLLR